MSSRFGEVSWRMPGNALQEEKDRTRGGGYDRSVFICPACKNKKSSREHKALKGKCSKQLQQKYFNEGGE